MVQSNTVYERDFCGIGLQYFVTCVDPQNDWSNHKPRARDVVVEAAKHGVVAEVEA